MDTSVLPVNRSVAIIVEEVIQLGSLPRKRVDLACL